MQAALRTLAATNLGSTSGARAKSKQLLEIRADGDDCTH